MLGNLSDRLIQSFEQPRSRGVFTESNVDQTISEIRRALINTDVALLAVRQLTNEVREKVYDAACSKALDPGQQVIRIVHEGFIKILGGQTRELSFADQGPTVFVLVGLQGAGKTTLVGKLDKWLHEEGKRTPLVALDLQWSNVVQQFQIVGERAGVEVWAPEPGNGIGDPAHIARTGLDHTIETGIDVVIVDTAGRLGADEETTAQAIAICDAVEPHEIMFILDVMVGQDAVQTSTAFRDGVGLTGAVLSKLDGNARGGVAPSVCGVTDILILFASTGEGLDDFERFHVDRTAGRILDMGDVLTLIEQAEKRLDAEEAECMAAKALSGELALAGLLSQLQQIKKFGSMKKILGMIPDATQMCEQIENFGKREVDRAEAIVYSMTPQEREDVSILNSSHRARVARGSGTSVAGVNGLAKRFEAAKKMMNQMGQAGGAMSDFGSMPGRGGKAKQKANAHKVEADRAKVKRKARPGNPARRRQQEPEALLPRDQRKVSAPGASLGAPTQEAQYPSMDDPPDDIKRMLQGLQ